MIKKSDRIKVIEEANRIQDEIGNLRRRMREEMKGTQISDDYIADVNEAMWTFIELLEQGRIN